MSQWDLPHQSIICIYTGDRLRTGVDGVIEPLRGHGRVLLDVAFVVVEGAIFARLEVVGVLHHLGVEFVEGGVGDHVLEDDEAVAGEGAESDFEVGGGETSLVHFGD